MNYSITATYLALLTLLYLFLGYRVVINRRRYKTGLGLGEDPTLAQAVRAHANFSEYVPLALLQLLLLEIGGLPLWALHAYGGALLFARLIHAHGLNKDSGRTFGRYYGTLVTWLLLLAGAVTLLVRNLL